ncbi:hypothetical protein [Hydrocarboniphaga sp.]|uniref:hypothetical protein n=1 Tax=Hydrocarboniphaga sp. TaxID=2033016 RepID=UPI00261E495E|nr:hypothetical protein [Hydrocarboniphaga sp.]
MTHGWNALAPARRRCALAAVLMLVPALLAAADPSIRVVGAVQTDALVELSGIAVSRRVPGRWWGHNDSGNLAELFAFDGRGHSLGRVAIDAPELDWEDMASYERDGVAYLAVADTGDNFSFRSQLAIQIVAEPSAELPAQPLKPLRTIAFRFEDGPRDCESLAADPAKRRFLLIDKQRSPAGVYELPMDPPPGVVATARRIADLPPLYRDPLPPASPAGSERYRGTATAADLSAEGRRLAVLTYTHLALFERRGDEDWPQAFKARDPLLLRLPALRIAEGMGLSADGKTALIGGERLHSPLLRWDEAPH